MYDLLRGAAGKNDLATLRGFFQEPRHGIAAGKGTIDMMVFDTTARIAHLSRGPNYRVAWRSFEFGK